MLSLIQTFRIILLIAWSSSIWLTGVYDSDVLKTKVIQQPGSITKGWGRLLQGILKLINKEIEQKYIDGAYRNENSSRKPQQFLICSAFLWLIWMIKKSVAIAYIPLVA